jgi:hypothetical protein
MAPVLLAEVPPEDEGRDGGSEPGRGLAAGSLQEAGAPGVEAAGLDLRQLGEARRAEAGEEVGHPGGIDAAEDGGAGVGDGGIGWAGPIRPPARFPQFPAGSAAAGLST